MQHKHEIKNNKIPQSLVATPQIRIRKLCAKVIQCSKWLIAELHAWAKRYSWEKLVVTPSEKFFDSHVTERPVRPPIRPHPRANNL